MPSFKANEGQEISGWSQHCEELFQKLESTLASHSSIGTHYRTVREYSQRFELWAGFIGVFADGHMSLDERLRFNPEVRDLIVGMLKLLERNLNHGFWFGSANKKRVLYHTASPAATQEVSTALAVRAALDAMQGAIDRLHRLAVLIRKAPSYSLASRVQDFGPNGPAKTEEFRKMASLFVKEHFPGINASLATQLVSSISFRRLRLLYELKHNGRLKARRLQATLSSSHSEAETTRQANGPAPKQELSRSDDSPMEATPAEPHHKQIYDSSSSNMSDESIATSITQGHAYPPRPKPNQGNDYCACNWCSAEIKASDLNVPGWWKNHFMEDLQPYVCISEGCTEPVVFFKSLTNWRKHMENIHTTDWVRKVHSPQVWYCDIAPHEYVEFKTKESLENHMQKEHLKLGSEQLKRRLVRNVLPSLRERDICPLCNENISKIYEPKQRSLGESGSPHSTVPYRGTQLPKDPKGKSQDLTYSSNAGRETYKGIKNRIQSSSTSEKMKKLDSRKVAKHIAGHLKSLAFFSIRYLEDDVIDDDYGRSSRAETTIRRIPDDFPNSIDGKPEFVDIPRAEGTDVRQQKHLGMIKELDEEVAIAPKREILISNSLNEQELQATKEIAKQRLFRTEGFAVPKDAKYYRPLLEATSIGDETAVRLVLEKGANLESKDINGRTPLSRAAEQGHEAILQLLLKKGADSESKDENGWTPLLLAAGRGHKAVVRLLLERGVDLESSVWGWTPLLLAAGRGHGAVVELLLKKGANLGAKVDKNGWTPLLAAASIGHEGIVRLLSEGSVDLDSKDAFGQAPLWLAAVQGYDAVVRLLAERGADLNSENGRGRTPLFVAAEKGHEAVVRLLIEKGANLESKDTQGWTPLSMAAREGRLAVVRLLAEKGADLEPKDINGRTPYLLAVRAGHPAVVRLLFEKGASSGDRQGRTPPSFG